MIFRGTCRPQRNEYSHPRPAPSHLRTTLPRLIIAKRRMQKHILNWSTYSSQVTMNAGFLHSEVLSRKFSVWAKGRILDFLYLFHSNFILPFSLSPKEHSLKSGRFWTNEEFPRSSEVRNPLCVSSGQATLSFGYPSLSPLERFIG